jgi:hypothetical protein
MLNGSRQRLGQWFVLQLGPVNMAYIEAHKDIGSIESFPIRDHHSGGPPAYSLDLDTLQDMYAALEACSGNQLSASILRRPATPFRPESITDRPDWVQSEN